MMKERRRRIRGKEMRIKRRNRQQMKSIRCRSVRKSSRKRMNKRKKRRRGKKKRGGLAEGCGAGGERKGRRGRNNGAIGRKEEEGEYLQRKEEGRREDMINEWMEKRGMRGRY